MSEHPIRLVVGDDLERHRLTVFFRALLAVPHFIWLLLWSIAALLAAVVNWGVTLVRGRSPGALHKFLAAYVKYVTQFYAYLHLAANSYPAFDGQDGYPIDLVIAAPERQSRLSVAFRGVLLLPAALLVTSLVGAPKQASIFSRGFSLPTSFGLLYAVALLGWFAIMARGAMPRGLRDAAAYALSYGAQFWGYALLLTDRYPDSDPLAAVPELPAHEDPIHVHIRDELRRSRLTVFFRLLLSFPHLIWLGLWGIVALPATILAWFATLFSGRTPGGLHRFLGAFLRYQLHVYAFLYLVANPFPGFVGKLDSYPVELVVAERRRQKRWKTAFRLILVVPAWILMAAYSGLAGFVALLGWFSSLARGRMPRGLRNTGVLALRYQSQTFGYLLLLTDVYPYSGPVRDGGEEGSAHAEDDCAGGPRGEDRPLPGGGPAPANSTSPAPGALPDIGLG